MATNACETYLESRILTADPVELVHILCRSVLDAIRQARLDLREGRIRERSRAITRASDILNELALSLDHQAGGDLSRNLAELYAYVQKLLVDGNTRQQDAPLAEAENLVTMLAEAWQACRPAFSLPTPAGVQSPTDYTPISCTF